MNHTAPAVGGADALTTAASVLAAAALIGTAGAAGVSVTVTGSEISIQVPVSTGDQPARTKVVAAYAHALSAPVRHRPGAAHTWIEARGTIAGHPVHVWTMSDTTPRAVA